MSKSSVNEQEILVLKGYSQFLRRQQRMLETTKQETEEASQLKLWAQSVLRVAFFLMAAFQVTSPNIKQCLV
jgi:hypothetical protein